MRTDLSIKELLTAAKIISNLPSEPNLREIPSELNSLLSDGDGDQFSIGYRRSSGITQFFVQGHGDDLDGQYLTRDLLKRVGYWHSAMTFVIVQTIRWLDGNKPEFINPPNDSPISDLMGFSKVDGGAPGGVMIDLDKDKQIVVTMDYKVLTTDMTLSKFLEMIM